MIFHPNPTSVPSFCIPRCDISIMKNKNIIILWIEDGSIFAYKIAAGFQQQDNDLLARCKPPSGIKSCGFVDRKIAPVDLRIPRETRTRGWRSKLVDVEGIDLFLDLPSSSVARNLEARLWTSHGYEHPEPLNHPILISRTVRRTYPTYIPSFHVPGCPAIFLARWWIKREYESVVSVIWIRIGQSRSITYNWITLLVIVGLFIKVSSTSRENCFTYNVTQQQGLTVDLSIPLTLSLLSQETFISLNTISFGGKPELIVIQK